MKKLLLTLVIALSFGSAFAKNVVEKNIVGFALNKEPTTLQFLLKPGDAQIKSSNQCEQDCWDNRRICYPVPPGETYQSCNLPFQQCRDSCEGAGGLYQ